MIELLRHDFKLISTEGKKKLAILLFLPVGIYLLDLSFHQPELYIHPILSFLIFLIGILISNTNDLTGVLMNSLPIKKVEIVKSRFIFMIINTSLITIYLLFVAYLLRASGYGIYTEKPSNILAFINTAFTILAIFMPFSFLNTRSIEIVFIIIFFSTLWFGWLMWRVALMHLIFNTIVTIILLVLSYLLSKQLFNEKEFL